MNSTKIIETTPDAAKSGWGEKQKRNRFTGERTHPQHMPPRPTDTNHKFIPLNLYELGTTGMMDYCRGVSPYHPKLPLVGKPTQYWRLRQIRIVIESRHGIDTPVAKRYWNAMNQYCMQNKKAAL